MIKEALSDIKNEIPEEVTLVAVSKTKPQSDILEAYEAGQRIFGENRARELEEKAQALPKDIEWHMIGHLQSNKVKYIAPYVTMIHAIDKFKLIKEIHKQAAKNNRIIKVLLQFHIAEEESKYGLTLEKAREMLDQNKLSDYPNVQICGVMGMATFTDDENKVRAEFKRLKNIFDHMKTNFFADQNEFQVISMGMSGDYTIAIEEGSTMIRVGSNIFGERS